jgi:hypothetical protein
LEGRFADLAGRRLDQSHQGRAASQCCQGFHQLVPLAQRTDPLQKYDDLYGQEPPNSRRIDIPKDMLPPSSRLVEGRRYFDFSEPKYSDMTPIYQLAKEFMKGRDGK